MEKTYDVVALGELLIDFTSNGNSAQGNPVFEANPGGAPCNVLAMLAQLGKKTAFIGKLGNDMFAQYLVDAVGAIGIDTKGIVFDPQANTTLAFVRNAPDGDRFFSFFRNPGADTLLAADELCTDLIEDCRIFHFGSLSLTHQPARTATQKAVLLARQAGALISFDPNLRPALWSKKAQAKRQIAWGCANCDILKISAEELTFMVGPSAAGKEAEALKTRFPNIKILFITKGKAGAEAHWGGHRVDLPTFTAVKTIDTTGAGDAFCGCCLAALLQPEWGEPDKNALKDIVLFANAAASLVTTKKGALRSMPSEQDIRKLMAAE